MIKYDKKINNICTVTDHKQRLNNYEHHSVYP